MLPVLPKESLRGYTEADCCIEIHDFCRQEWHRSLEEDLGLSSRQVRKLKQRGLYEPRGKHW